MTRLTLGLICGAAFGLLSLVPMIPMTFTDKRAALLGSFVNRFAIGLLIPVVTLPLPSWGTGVALGLLLSVPDAIITRAYAPIIGFGALGGLVIGFIAGRA